MKFLKNNTTFTNRQTFVCMIESILVDFCELPECASESKSDLIESIIIKYFEKDLIDLSKDKVVNVRIKLADTFMVL